jgi:hypothetical protein
MPENVSVAPGVKAFAAMLSLLLIDHPQFSRVSQIYDRAGSP